MFIKEKSQGDHRNLIQQNTASSSPRSTGTFCYVIHGLSHMPKRPPPSLVKDRKLVSAYKFSTLGFESSFTLKIFSIITN